MFSSIIIGPRYLRASGDIPNLFMGWGGGQGRLSRGRSIIRFRLWAGHSDSSMDKCLLERKSGGTLIQV